MKNKEKIIVSMIGLGYIGLPTAALMASKNIRVNGVDVKPEVVETINRGDIHIIEPALDGLVKHAVNEGYLKASTQIQKSDIFLIAVPTPFKTYKQTKYPDITYVESAIQAITPLIEEENLIIIESTSPVGTTDDMYDHIVRQRPELRNRFYMAYCPERVLPGNIIYELSKNERAIGGINEDSTQKAKDFYSLFVKGELHTTNARTAEMCKLTENAYRDTNIAFANELSIICDQANIDTWELINLANKHPRVNILQPGVGVGGHCIAVDPWFIISQFEKEAKMMRTAREINTYKTEWTIEKIKRIALQFEYAKRKKPKIVCLGLAFKPNIDDLRESPALYIVKDLIKSNLDILAVEPNVKKHEAITLTPYHEALKKGDVFIKLVGHEDFDQLEQKIDPEKKIVNFCSP